MTIKQISARVGELLTRKKKTLMVAESCTGGMISQTITAMPGASAFFLGGIVSYHNAVKSSVFGVKKSVLKSKGAVSEEVAMQMARGARKRFKSDYAVAVTGVAGPSGGTLEKPVGTVYVSAVGVARISVCRMRFKGARLEIQKKTTRRALELLLEVISQKEAGQRRS